MGDILSVRLDEKLNDLINKYLRDHEIEKSEGIRQLLVNGIYMRATKEYFEGKVSVGKAAAMVGASISDFFDFLCELGVRSTLDVDDVLDGYENLLRLKERKDGTRRG
ncbi:MAG: hypothetical protein ACTSU5_09525 [Promethearchaeota archaeon]